MQNKGRYSMVEKPERCVDPVIKDCMSCEWGYCNYPSWVETSEDLEEAVLEVGCILGYDQGRPEDEPTEEEKAEFERWCNHSHNP